MTITADPPAAASTSAAQAAVTPAVNVLSAVLPASSATFSGISAIGTAQSAIGSNAGITSNGPPQPAPLNGAGQLPINNWSLPTSTTINSNLGSGIADQGSVAAIGDSDVVSVGAEVQGLRPVSAAASKELSGGVSNTCDSVKILDQGVTFMAPKKATTLNTAFGPVQIAAGSVVMVMAFDGGIAVYKHG